MCRNFLIIIFFYPFFILGQTKLDSSYLPIIIINTDSQEIADEDRTICSLGIINNTGINNVGDDFNEYNGRISIEIRGQSSMYFPKKSYSFETQDSLGENYNVSLLGMPAENDWVLYAPYADKSFLRNALTYYLYEKMGYYSPRFKFCNLLLDNEYMGIYLLTEKIKRDKNRVDVNELEPEDSDMQDISGGYIIQVDRASDNPDKYWTSSFNDSIYFQYIYPRWKKINNQQKSYIQEFIYDFEHSILNSDLSSLHILYKDLINVDSFVDYFIISELSKNIDAYRLSTYLYKDHDSIDHRLHIGPVWDYNWAYGNSTYCQADIVSGWEQETPCGIFNPFWYSIFRSDSLFNSLLKCRWVDLRSNLLKEDVIYSYIDSIISVNNYEINKDMRYWGHIENTTHNNEIFYLKEWISQRFKWLDENMPGYCEGFSNQQKGHLMIVTDLLGRVLYKPSSKQFIYISENVNIQHYNIVMLYIYSDGTVEKKIILE